MKYEKSTEFKRLFNWQVRRWARESGGLAATLWSVIWPVGPSFLVGPATHVQLVCKVLICLAVSMLWVCRVRLDAVIKTTLTVAVHHSCMVIVIR